MSTHSGYPQDSGHGHGNDVIDLDVQRMSGEAIAPLRVERSKLGSEVRKMVLKKLTFQPGRKLDLKIQSISEEDVRGPVTELKLHQTLQEQGFAGAKRAILVCTYLATPLQAAWCFLKGFKTSEAERSLEGATQLTAFPSRRGLHLPEGLRSLTFDDGFNESLEGVTFPSSLRSLSFGWKFNKSLKDVVLPESLDSLTFGAHFNQRLKDVTLPGSLHSLTFGADLNQSLEDVTLPGSLHSLTFGAHFNQSLKDVTLPESLHSLTFGAHFNQSLKDVTLPGSLHSLTFGTHFNQSLKDVELPKELRSLTFGADFNQSLKDVPLPQELHSLTFGANLNTLEGVTFPSMLRMFCGKDVLISSLEVQHQ